MDNREGLYKSIVNYTALWMNHLISDEYYLKKVNELVSNPNKTNEHNERK